MTCFFLQKQVHNFLTYWKISYYPQRDAPQDLQIKQPS